MERSKGLCCGMFEFATGVIKNLAEYVLVLLTILECNSLFYYYAGRESSNEKFLRMGLLAVALFLVVFRLIETKEKKSIVKILPTIGGVYVLTGIFLVMNVMKKTGLKTSFIEIFMIFLPCVTLLFYLDRVENKPYNLIYKYANIIKAYAFVAIVVYLFTVFFKFKMPIANFYTHWSNKGNIRTLDSYLGLFAVSEDKFFSIGGYDFYKLIGIFPEPPMAMIPLVTSFYAELFLKGKKSDIVALIVLVLTVLFTGSTLGYMLVLMGLALKLIEVVPRKFRVYTIIGLAVVIVGAVAVLFLFKRKNDSGSLSAHVEDYILCLKAFLQSPIFGNAYANDGPIQAFMSETRFATNSGLSNSIAVILAQGGAVLELICIVPFIRGLVCIFSKKKNSKREALFFVGIFALYVVTIFIYKFYLMFLMAFGYSLLPFKLSDEPDPVFDGEKDKGRTPLLVLGGVFLLSVILTLGNVWKWIFAFLKTNSLLLSQSAWNLVFAMILVMAFGEMICLAAKTKSKLNVGLTAFVFAVSLVLFFAQSKIVTIANSFCGVLLKTSYAKLFVIALNLMVVVCAYVLLLSIISFKWKKIFSALAVVCVAVPIVCFSFVHYVTNRKTDYFMPQVEADSEVLSVVTENASGKVYSDVISKVYQSVFPKISDSSKSGEEFSQLENISVLMTGNYPQLIDAGFACVQTADDRALYTNDEEVIFALKENGYKVYNHYPNSFSVDVVSLAYMNGLTPNEDGTVDLNGDEKIISHGPYLTLDDGTYLFTFNFKSESHSTITVKAIADDGETVIKSKTSKPDEYSEWDNLSLSIKFKASDIRNLQLVIYSDGEATLKKVSYAQKPYYDTVNYRNEYNQIVRTEYLKDNEPYALDDGYSAVEKEYDKNGNVICLSYFGVDGESMTTSKGYSELERSFDSDGNIISEAYFNFGEAVLCGDDYASLIREYTKKGKIKSEAYFDLDGAKTKCAFGYAEVRYEYGKRGKLTKVSYFDELGNPTMCNSGYAEIQYTYDSVWSKRTGEKYFDTDGNEIKID